MGRGDFQMEQCMTRGTARRNKDKLFNILILAISKTFSAPIRLTLTSPRGLLLDVSNEEPTRQTITSVPTSSLESL